MANNVIDIQVASKGALPKLDDLERWANAALAAEAVVDAELTIRAVDRAEMTALNTQYRQKNGPTNVLSFPAEIPEEIDLPLRLLGDIVICVDVVAAEAKVGQLPVVAHWAHMVVHGVLHLLGYDHVDEKEALLMEAREGNIMRQLGFDDPYRDDHD